MALELDQQHENVSSAGAKTKPNWQTDFFKSRRVTPKARMLFIEQLSMMLETGSDLHSSLNTLKVQNGQSEMGRIIGIMSDDISEGNTFSSALAKHPHVFSSTYVSLIAASESGGYIRQILNHLLAMEKQREDLDTTLISAAAYPVFLILFSLGMVVFMLAVVFPKFATLFDAIKNELPPTTLFLMHASDLIVQYWWALIAGLILVSVLLLSWVKSETGQKIFDRLKLKTPFFKHIFIKLYLIRTMHILGLSLSHGVNLIESLDIAKDVVKNREFEKYLDQFINDVNEGRKLASGVNKIEFIPLMVKQMIATGEETGNLAMVCNRIAEYFQKELEKLLKFFSKAIEPIMLVFMGALVGIMVSSLILPIFKLSHAVH